MGGLTLEEVCYSFKVMTRPVVPVLVVCLLAATGLWSKPVSTAKAKAAVVKRKVAARKSPAKGTASRYKPSIAQRYSPPAAPGSERIKEIQQALLDRGYLSTQPDGVWSAQCVEGLKRFEADKKFKMDGKIDSRILIALGLGPKYDENLSLPVPGSGGVVVAEDGKNDLQRIN